MTPEFLPDTPEGRLWRLVEECVEVAEKCNLIAYTACKAGRFGMNTVKHGSWSGPSPRERLLKAFAALRSEVTDLEHAVVAVEADLGTSALSEERP